MDPIDNKNGGLDLGTNDNIIGYNNVNSSTKQRKLVLHFDIRNTVLVADSVTNVSMEQALNSFLTGVVWGQEHSKGQWEWHSYEPSLGPPSPEAVTYYKYLEKRLVQTPRERQMLRLATGDFTSESIGKPFYDTFTSTLKNLRWRYEVEPDHKIMTMSGKDGKPYHYLLTSVYKLIHHLKNNNRDFAIVFRTYGLDAPNVISSLAHGLSGNHPAYPNVLDMPINLAVGTVDRADNDDIAFFATEEENTKQFRGDREVYDMLSGSQGVSGFKDDFIHWQNNDYNHDCAKPLYIDPYDESVHHVFFDDNIRTFEDDSIVNVRMFKTKDCNNSTTLSKEEAAKFENTCLVQADLLRAIEDTDYFIDGLAKCERNYTKFLQRYNLAS